MNHSLLEDTAYSGRLPVHLGERVLDLQMASYEHGEHSTAVKLATLIDLVLSHLGRLWIAEYLHAGAPDARLNRELFDRLGRNVLLSLWVGFSHDIRELFREQELPTVVLGLAEQDFGTVEEPEHAISRLVTFRNSVSHGSMVRGGTAEILQDLRLHRDLLEAVLGRVPGLVQQPIRFRTGEDGTVRTATLGWEPAPDAIGAAEPPLQPFVVGRDGETVLRLYPLLYVAEDEGGYVLRHGSARNTRHPLTSLFERGTLRMYYQRYQREQQGHLEFDEALAGRDATPVPEAVLAEVRAALSDDAVSLVVVEAHPGCGKSAVLAALRALAPAGRYADIFVYVVTPGDLPQSGVTFARYLLRRAERVLGWEDGSFASDPAKLLETLREANRALRQADLRLLVGVEDLHFGYEAYRGEALTVAEVYRSLAGGTIQVVATIHPGRSAERLVFDRKVVIPIPEADRIDRPSLARAVEELCPPAVPLRRRVLEQLLHHPEPLALFALCDALEQTGLEVFEPAVERALWDLRPLLRVERSGGEKVWAPFTPALAELDLLPV